MGAVQMMCARIGMVTGEGLAAGLHARFSRWLVVPAIIALVVVNTITVGADLSGMADAVEMLTGVNSHYLVVLFGGALIYGTLRFRYRQLADILKWLAASLTAYVITAFIIGPDWKVVAHDTFVPVWPRDHSGWAILVAILGTTISPYIFFWQASQDVEEDKAAGRRMRVFKQTRPPLEIADRAMDVGTGTFFSNLVMFFIILSAALTLHRQGITSITTSAQAAAALEPFAGRFATTLFALGILGAGVLAIPTLAGSAAYALAETFDWRQGLGRSLRGAREFYSVVTLSIVLGIVLDFANVDPIGALFLTSVINGLLAPFLVLGILLVASNRKIMNNQPSSLLSRVVVGLTTLLMFGAAAGMFLF
jgi:Mn2+/Fe2+ NRAMP family transporter